MHVHAYTCKYVYACRLIERSNRLVDGARRVCSLVLGAIEREPARRVMEGKGLEET